MRVLNSYHRYRTKEIFVIAIFLFSIASILQMLSIPPPSITEKTAPYKTLEEQFIESRDVSRLSTHEEEFNDDIQVLKFQPAVEVILPSSHPVKILGLLNLPDNFATETAEKMDLFQFRVEPERIIGDNGLLTTREFQGNSWSGTFMKGAIVFFIQSSGSHHRRRALLRETWASIRDIDRWKIEAVFVVGRPNSTKQQADIVMESSAYGDILQYNGPDGPSGDTKKALSAMQWASHNLPGDFHFASMPDDVIVNIAVVRDQIATLAPPVAPPGRVLVSTANDESTVTSSQPQKIYCFESYAESETTERDLKISRSVSVETYQAMKWPPYCTEGLYILPVSLTQDLYESSRRTNLQLPAELYDVLITGILRRKLNRGDENIAASTETILGKSPLLRCEVLPRSNEKRFARYELEAESKIRTTWSAWYEMIRYRFHIFSNTAFT